MTATTQSTAKRPGPALWVSIVLVAASAVLGMTSAVEAIVPFVQLAKAAPLDTPGAYRLHLHRGRYGVYEWTGSSDGSSGGFGSQSVTISAGMVRVTGTDGTTIPVNDVARGSRPTINHASDVYTEAVEFRVPRGGDYDIAIRTFGQGSVIVRRSVGDTFRQVRGWILGALTCALAFLVGAILLIVTLIRRSGKRNHVPGRSPSGYAPAYGGAPPGWGPATQAPLPPTWPPGPAAPAGPSWPSAPAGPTGPAGPSQGPPVEAQPQGPSWPAGPAGPAGSGWPAGPPQEPPVGAQPQGPAPGWYPDPAAPYRRRYWDGRQWTGHVS